MKGSLGRKLIRFRLLFQAFFFALFNLDAATFLRSIQQKKALISQVSSKQFCIPGLHCYSCPMSVLSCPLGSLQFWLNDVNERIRFRERINSAGLYIIGFLSLIGITVGRLFCGWVCPFGLVQDLINKITGKNLKLPRFLRYFKYVILVVFVISLPLFISDVRYIGPWFCKYICPAGTLMAGIPLLAVDEGLRQAASGITIFKISILVLFLVSFLFSRRSFCKTTCPLGAYWGLFNKISFLQLKVDKNTCINCGKCDEVCPMHLKVREEPNSPECIRCLACLKVCPVRAITFNAKTDRLPELRKKTRETAT
ncbi:MAG: 4Fe-4S binding protein [Spirochaetales bacterium]|nr:4Fe-4S binding protein [Spirochaetales bacterium]